MPIKVFPSLMPGEPIETHEWSGTVGAWLQSKGIDYLAQETQPITVIKDGVAAPVEQWADTVVDGDVEIRLLPHGGVLKGLGSIIGKIFNAVFGWLMPSSSTPGRNDTPQGQKLETSDAKANQAKLGDVVPELAGRFIRYPDYLTPPRRHFVNLREQWLEFHACVGPGRYQINAADVKVGDTPFSSLGADASYQLFEPGANLSGVTTHEHWHTVTEVGGTSSGTAGLELSTEFANRNNSQPSSYSFDGNTITRSSGTFPTGWGNGTIVLVSVPRTLSYSVTGGPVFPPTPNVFSGDFAHLGPLSNGDQVSVSGAGLSGNYLVQSVTSGSLQLWTVPIPPEGGDPGTPSEPVQTLTPGSYTMTFNRPRNLTISTMTDTVLTVSGGGYTTFSAPGSISFAGGTVYGEWTSEFVACPGNETTTTVEVDIFFPGGLAYISDSGTLQSRSVGIEIQYRSLAGGASTTVRRNYTQATLDQIGVTERLTIPAMNPVFRVRRVGASSTSTQVQDTVHWYGLKSRLPTRTSYSNWTTMSVKIRSGGRLAAQSENQINVVATRMLPTLQTDGTWGPLTATRDISAFVKYIASTIGYTDDNMHMAELQRLNTIWKSRGETIDYVFDQTTVKAAINTVLAAGMSELTVDDGLIKPVRDDIRTQFEQGYSPQNMTRPITRSFRSLRIDDPDGVEVEYVDGTTWAKEVVQCRLPGDMGFKVQKIKLDGVTDRTRAWRIGMRQRRATRYRNWEYSFETELDALNSGYLSYVPLVDDIPGYGQSAILEHIEPVSGGALLHVSEPLSWQEAQSHVVGYRRPDGTVAGPFPASPGPDEFSLIADMPEPWPVVTLKHEPPHVYFGTVEKWTFPALITEISPTGLERVRVKATNYDARVYADDNNTPT